MHKRTVEIAVGIFVLLGMLALLMLAVKVSGLSDIYESNNGYKVTAEFTNIGGLKPRAKVSMAGVAIGRVLSIEFDKDTFYAKVHMMIEQKFNNIPEDSQASIMTAGLLGDNYLGITPGMDDAVLANGSVIEVGNTNQALVLEDLISKFFSSKASGLNLDEQGDDE
jgi:phospholipid/cholesterol/gamma-HCH transport system substrate-binding protein